MGRVAEGSYVPGQLYRPAAPSHGCGPLDEFGRCSSRFHSGSCYETSRQEAAVGSAESVEAWNRALLRNQAIKADLDEETAFLGDPGPGPASDALMRELGLS
jgi:hypothetical protein